MIVTRQTPVKSNGKVVKTEVSRITVSALLRSVIGQHKTPSLFYWDTCGSPVIKRLLSSFFFLRHKMEKLRNSIQLSKGGKKTVKQNNLAYTSSIQRKLYFKQYYFLKSI